MAEPVVHLELEPGAGEDVHDRGRLELVARQQLAADEARVRLEQARQRLRIRALERDVAAEARADHPHRRAARGRCSSRRWSRASCGPPSAAGLGAAGAGVVEVLLAQAGAEADEREHAERPRQPVPAEAAVERGRRRDQQLREPEAKCPLRDQPRRRRPGWEEARPMKTSRAAASTEPAAALRPGVGALAEQPRRLEQVVGLERRHLVAARAPRAPRPRGGRAAAPAG